MQDRTFEEVKVNVLEQVAIRRVGGGESDACGDPLVGWRLSLVLVFCM